MLAASTSPAPSATPAVSPSEVVPLRLTAPAEDPEPVAVLRVEGIAEHDDPGTDSERHLTSRPRS